ncbi:hypothetical protein F2P79_022826 [Pimephales promelas]|nr:hypothetical protein F2P79_022826 [Pimephales promelas]
MAFVNSSLSELLYCTRERTTSGCSRREVLKDYGSLSETVRSTSPKATIIVSGPLPTCRKGQKRRMRSSLASFTPALTQHHGSHSGRDEPWPVLEPLRRPSRSWRSRPGTASPLFESERDDAGIFGTSMVRHVRATLGKGMVRTHCFPCACVLYVAAQVPEILNGDERIGAVVLNVGANDNRLRF